MNAQAAPPPPGWNEPEPGGGGVVANIANGIAHDLNNVLTVIAGNLALAERHAAGNAKLLRLLNNMRTASDKGAVLAQQLLALSPENPAPPVIAGPELSEDIAPSARILVVEDDPHVAELAVVVLEDMGHRVELRYDALSALALLEDGTKFDLVFSDIMMPGALNGIELAERLAARRPDLPVLLATGYSSAALSPAALRFPVLAKPYSVQELTRRVSQMLPVTGMFTPG